MNTYNDNLRSIVFDSLQKQELDQKKLTAQLKASKISLYYSQGARINAQEKLDTAKEDLTFKTSVQEQSIKNANLSTNLLASADQEKTYMDLSVTNAATCASNVQIAANAVLKLASDVGSIYSIVNAADYGEDVYKSAEEVKKLMDQTAYHAEVASQNAMEASEYTASVSYKQVASLAKLTDTSVKGVLDIADAEFNKSSSIVTADSAVVATDSNKEKVSEGKLEDVNVDYNAAVTAYQSLNNELNLKLKVTPEAAPTLKANEKPKSFTPSYFNVSFTSILSPFQLSTDDPGSYPVTNYYAILVKYNQRATFNLANAESLINHEDPTKTKSCYPIPFPDAVPPTGEGLSMTQNINLVDIVDSDGDEFEIGKKYVVFIFAQYNDAYKRKINDFEDFLSAPSKMLTITHQLVAPLATDMKVTTIELESSSTTVTQELAEQVNEEAPIDKEKKVTTTNSKKRPLSTTFSFTINANANSVHPVEYRCMFLPVSKSLTKGLLTKNGLRSIEDEVEQFEAIYESFNSKLLAAQKKLDQVLKTISDKPNQLETLKSQIKEINAKDKPTKKDQANLTKYKAQQQTLEGFDDIAEKTAAQQAVQDVINARQKAIEEVKLDTTDDIDFFFDLDLAEVVSAANYTVPKKEASASEVVSEDQVETWSFTLSDNTTDNFGSPLIPGNEYLPVVLAQSAAQEVDLSKYTNAITPYEEANQFVYQTIVIKS